MPSGLLMYRQGSYVPLLALLAYLVHFRHFGLRATLRILSVTVPATLVGTAMTLWSMHALYAPVTLASKALHRYLDSSEIPQLPVATRTGACSRGAGSVVVLEARPRLFERQLRVSADVDR